MSEGDSGLLHRLFHPVTKHMSLAVRVGVLTTFAVAITLGIVSSIIWFSVRAQFVSSVDSEMFRRAHAAVAAGYTPTTINNDQANLMALMGMRILVAQGGDLLTSQGSTFPFTHHEIEVSIGQAMQSARTTRIDHEPYRVIAVQAGPGEAFVLAQSLSSTETALNRLALVLVLCSSSGMILAGIAGWGVAANGLRPVRRLTDATERVARTQDLAPIEVTGQDELARLGNSFNTMLRALDEAQIRERQLIADAGHELRTPLTSLRTNLDLLAQASQENDGTGRQLSPELRRELLADVRGQADELTNLVGDLVELARDEPLHREPEPLDLADVTRAALERVRRRATTLTFDVDLASTLMIGDSAELERAITNLLDNAAKWSPDGSTVRVRLDEGVLTVADQGPGIDAADLPHVFDRFYRSSEARTLPGSGLGLSIVRRAADRHGGTVEAASGDGGGTLFTLTLPGSDDD